MPRSPLSAYTSARTASLPAGALMPLSLLVLAGQRGRATYLLFGRLLNWIHCAAQRPPSLNSLGLRAASTHSLLHAAAQPHERRGALLPAAAHQV
jgi:hypothetical protein